jgi:hypothetical protein
MIVLPNTNSQREVGVLIYVTNYHTGLGFNILALKGPTRAEHLCGFTVLGRAQNQEGIQTSLCGCHLLVQNERKLQQEHRWYCRAQREVLETTLGLRDGTRSIKIRSISCYFMVKCGCAHSTTFKQGPHWFEIYCSYSQTEARDMFQGPDQPPKNCTCSLLRCIYDQQPM